MKSTARRTSTRSSGHRARGLFGSSSQHGKVSILTVSALATVLLFVAFVALSVTALGTSQSASAATPKSVSQCDGTDAGNPNFAAYAAGGAGITCTITVENEFDVATGTTSSTLSLNECVGAADANTFCTPTVTPSTSLIGSIDQCKGVGNSGGSKIVCIINIVNTIVGGAPAGAATVNQCIGSGTGAIFPIVDCTPGGNTTNAVVTQCNGSGNGGTLVLLACSSDATVSASLPFTINQCNGTGNGGGAYVDCEVTVTNIITAVDSGSPTGTATGTPTDSPTGTPTDTPTSTPTDTPTSTPTDTPTSTPTDTPTSTPTSTPTDTPTSTPTDTPTSTPTDTPTSTPTDTPTSTPTDTPTSTPTDTPTSTPTDTPTSTPTDTPTSSPTDTATPTPTVTATITATPTPTASASASASATTTATASAAAATTGTGGSGGSGGAGGGGSGSGGSTSALAETGLMMAPALGIGGAALLLGILGITAVTALRRRRSHQE
ncbi:hypothetical protein [Subtercola sp. YIM 133946]|uniref:hypothetical protein n=1 Tax=Subtercola sp. YIM 133946 TaxID=3118909 RepID=UPI002F922812